ncbi:hypothetical protein CVT24_007501 [Panaeolus cyanescens]|uniref:Uncharacterized protein n=1 Tax=Panaeolus cyanescens TaxID=181874 RepID=A0A409W9X7_9AGAR|nr:hypothetical protein CVT24_007501 [Panaeolus cyanescens]
MSSRNAAHQHGEEAHNGAYYPLSPTKSDTYTVSNTSTSGTDSFYDHEPTSSPLGLTNLGVYEPGNKGAQQKYIYENLNSFLSPSQQEVEKHLQDAAFGGIYNFQSSSQASQSSQSSRSESQDAEEDYDDNRSEASSPHSKTTARSTRTVSPVLRFETPNGRIAIRPRALHGSPSVRSASGYQSFARAVSEGVQEFQDGSDDETEVEYGGSSQSLDDEDVEQVSQEHEVRSPRSRSKKGLGREDTLLVDEFGNPDEESPQ